MRHLCRQPSHVPLNAVTMMQKWQQYRYPSSVELTVSSHRAQCESYVNGTAATLCAAFRLACSCSSINRGIAEKAHHQQRQCRALLSEPLLSASRMNCACGRPSNMFFGVSVLAAVARTGEKKKKINKGKRAVQKRGKSASICCHSPPLLLLAPLLSLPICKRLDLGELSAAEIDLRLTLRGCSGCRCADMLLRVCCCDSLCHFLPLCHSVRRRCMRE